MMQTITLNNGVPMPTLGFGVYNIGKSETVRCVREAIECGYRLIDTAQWYGNEEEVGRAVAECGLPREDIFITTKLQSGQLVVKSVEESLRKLRSEYIDLLLIHWPMGEDAAIWATMEGLYDCGKLHSIGLSNFYGSDFENILHYCQVMPQVIQQELHPFRQQREQVEKYRRLGIVPQAWSPLACGRENIFTNSTLVRIGAAHGQSAAQTALRFLVQCGVCPIPKTSHRERMVENIDIFGFELSEDELDAIRALDRGHGLFGWYD